MSCSPNATQRPGRGRPEKLGHTEREVAIALIAVGCSRASAAKYLGVARQTIANTAARDPEFANRLERAAIGFRLGHLRNVTQADGRSWRASAWALERIDPATFGDRPERIDRARRRLRAAVRRLFAALLPPGVASDLLTREALETLDAELKPLGRGGRNHRGRPSGF